MAKITTVELQNGEKRYRFTADVGRDENGRRLQRRFTFSRLKDAKAKLAEVGHTVNDGTYVDRSRVTVSDVIDSYLANKEFREENTRASYEYALKPARDRLGHLRAQHVTLEDINRFKKWMLTEGRRRGGKPGTGLGPRSVQLTLGRLSAAFELAVKTRKIAGNPVRYAEMPEQPRKKRVTWSAEQARAFLAAARADRLCAAWLLTLYGLRRGEVCGLRWSDVDLEARLITITSTRVVVNGKVITKAPKSDNGIRALPLDDGAVAALTAVHDRQVLEHLEAGDAYEESGYVVTDELGRPVHPDWYSDEFRRLREAAGLPAIRLHDGRHTANSLMAAAGVPPHIRAAWCGHTQAVNEDTYTHARPEDMAAALGALSALYGTPEKPV